jgi:hypothetical protein
MLPTYIKRENEQQLQEALVKKSAELGQKLSVISIYPRGSYVIAWFFVDTGNPQGTLKPDEKTTKKKKTTRRKR